MYKKHGGKIHEISRSVGHFGHGRHQGVGVRGEGGEEEQGTVASDLNVA